VCGVWTAVAAAAIVCGGLQASEQAGTAVISPASRVDPYAERARVVVMTDIANEPDDQMSMVRFLVYSNRFDVEGLIATTSTWMKNKVRPDVIGTLIDAYEQVQPNLAKHPEFPPAEALRKLSRASRHMGWPPWVRQDVGRGRADPRR
jgi:hypothetical protein